MRRLVPSLAFPQVVCGSQIDGVSAVIVGGSVALGALVGVGCGMAFWMGFSILVGFLVGCGGSWEFRPATWLLWGVAALICLGLG